MYIMHSDSAAGPDPNEAEVDFQKGVEAGRNARAAHPEWTFQDISSAAADYATYYLMNDKRAVRRMNGFLKGAGGQ